MAGTRRVIVERQSSSPLFFIRSTHTITHWVRKCDHEPALAREEMADRSNEQDGPSAPTADCQKWRWRVGVYVLLFALPLAGTLILFEPRLRGAAAGDSDLGVWLPGGSSDTSAAHEADLGAWVRGGTSVPGRPSWVVPARPMSPGVRLRVSELAQRRDGMERAMRHARVPVRIPPLPGDHDAPARMDAGHPNPDRLNEPSLVLSGRWTEGEKE